MILRNLSVGLLLAILSFIVVSCGEKHACVGLWEGGGNSKTQKVYRLSIKDDGNFELTIIPERPDGYIQLYTGPQTHYNGTWKVLSDNEIELNSIKRTEYLHGSKDYMESKTFYLRQDGAFCINSQDFLYPDVDLIKEE